MITTRGRNIDLVLDERRARRRSRIITVVAAGLLVAATAYIAKAWYDQRQIGDPTEHRVVVAPFDNRTGDRSLDDLGLVTADWVTNALTTRATTQQAVPTTTAIAYFRSAGLRRYDPFNQARMLGRGTRAHIVVHGSYYRVGDELRFHIDVHDVRADTSWKSMPDVVVPADSPLAGVQGVRRTAVRQLLNTFWRGRLIELPVPDRETYAVFLRGLHAYAQRDYARAADYFMAVKNADALQAYVYAFESLVRSRQFARADSLIPERRHHSFTYASQARFMRSLTSLRSDRHREYLWAVRLAELNPADDVARFDHALAALALNQPREARRLFSDMYPNRGALYGRPEFYLHYAAAYHLLGQHRQELNVVRDGQLARPRSIAVRLAYCRVRAAQGNEENALSALRALVYADIDTTGAGISVVDALEDCGAELDAHGLPGLAREAAAMARVWRRGGVPAQGVAADSVYEPGEVRLQQARGEAQAGNDDQAINTLRRAFEQGLRFYQPGRVMLHADPGLARLRDTPAFRGINQPQG